MSSLLAVSEVCKGYISGDNRLEVLTDLSISLEAGDMVAITGVSGSGKSTLLHLIGGMDRPDKGSVQILGKELFELTPIQLSEFRNEIIGFVFQFHHLLPEFSAVENVMMPLLLRGKTSVEARASAADMLAEVGLDARRTHRPGELSGGEQQRVALARALVGQPHLLLADEPTGNLDPHTGEAVGELFLELHQRRRLTSILVTHNEKLARICSRVYHLENGRLNRV